MRGIFTALFIAALPACVATSIGWSKPGLTEEQYRQDADACRTAVQGEFHPGARAFPFYQDGMKQSAYDHCMKNKGYKIVARSIAQ